LTRPFKVASSWNKGYHNPEREPTIIEETSTKQDQRFSLEMPTLLAETLLQNANFGGYYLGMFHPPVDETGLLASQLH
jgi:hypothetical protein